MGRRVSGEIGRALNWEVVYLFIFILIYTGLVLFADGQKTLAHTQRNKQTRVFLVCFSVQYISPPKHTHTHFCYIYFFYVSNLLSLDTGLYIWNYETDHRNKMKQMTKTIVTTQWETIRWGGWNIWRSETLSRGEGEQNFFTKGGSDSRRTKKQQNILPQGKPKCFPVV